MIILGAEMDGSGFRFIEVCGHPVSVSCIHNDGMQTDWFEAIYSLQMNKNNGGTFIPAQ